MSTQARRAAVRTYRFGPYELDPAGELRKFGVPLRLQKKPFLLLRALIERPGEIVSRTELQERLWPGTFVDFEQNLNIAVRKVRDALCDSAEEPKYVETIPGQGYRWVAPLDDVVTAASAASRVASIAEDVPAVPPVAPTATPRYRQNLLIGIGALVFCALAAVVLLRLRPSTPRVYQSVQFTTMPGAVNAPSFSPDGNELVFAYTAPPPSRPRLYVQSVGTTAARKLIDDPEPTHAETTPHWSPDGSSILYIRILPGVASEIWSVAAMGGVPRKLFDLPNRANQGWDIAPDGKSVVISTSDTPAEPTALYLISLQTGERRKLTSPARDPSDRGILRDGDMRPHFSHDGNSIAFLRLHGVGIDLLTYSIARGSETTLLRSQPTILDLLWLNGDESLLLNANHENSAKPALWKFWLKERRWEPVPAIGSSFFSPALSRDGRRLAFLQGGTYRNIWRFELPGKQSTAPGSATNLTNSTMPNMAPTYSPDGQRIAFDSQRSGHYEIYAANADGSAVVQLTSFNGDDAGSPRWSPDGKQITFDYRPDNHVHIYTVDANGGVPRQMTSGDHDDVLPRYSRDGKWIYFARQRKDGSDVWKIPAGGGDAQFVLADGFMLEESVDAKTFYYTAMFRTEIYARDAAGGAVRTLTTVPGELITHPLMIEPDGLFFSMIPAATDNRRSALTQLLFFDFATGSARKVMEFPERCGFSPQNQSVSPDGRYVLTTCQSTLQLDLMLVDNFR